MRRKTLSCSILILWVAITANSPAWGGGSCINSGDCNDGNGCTTDTCVSNICQHAPVPSGTACGDPSDTVCTNPDTCNAVGICQRNDAANGTACTLPSPCITGESCDFGYCRGTYTLNCCTSESECTDSLPCTNDACIGNVCTHTPVSPGTACGSSVDDACTNPDTCNPVGECQTNDTPDGESCGGPECLGGQCGTISYQANLLPEGGNLGSEPRDECPNNDTNAQLIVGRVINAAMVDHAAAWNCPLSGGSCTLALLPEGGSGTSVANGVACDNAGSCVAVGSKGSPPQPAVWVNSGGGWSAQTLTLPSGATGGALRSVANTSGGTLTTAGTGPSFIAVGETNVPVAAIQMKRAAYCGTNSSWSLSLLPDLSFGRESGASDIVQCDASAPPGLCDNGELLIAGFAVDGPGVVHPIVWRETSAFSGNFSTTTLPLPAGSLGLDLNSWDEGGLVSFKYDDAGRVISKVTHGGTTKGAVWRTEDFVGWTTAVLPPLMGHQNGTTKPKKVRIEAGATGTAGPEAPPVLAVYGSSSPASGDPLGTRWTLDVDTLALISGPTNMNDFVSGLPAGVLILEVGGSSSAATSSGSIQNRPILHTSSSSSVAGTQQPHAAVAVAVGPAGIPTVSTWGVVTMTLLVLLAGTIVIRRGRQAMRDPIRVESIIVHSQLHK